MTRITLCLLDAAPSLAAAPATEPSHAASANMAETATRKRQDTNVAIEVACCDSSDSAETSGQTKRTHPDFSFESGAAPPDPEAEAAAASADPAGGTPESPRMALLDEAPGLKTRTDTSFRFEIATPSGALTGALELSLMP